MKRITFIVNPVSGGKDKRKVLAAIDRYLDRSAFSYEVRETGKAGDATAWARSCDADIVVAVGGDGTVSEVATGLLGTGKALGIIPCGSGDGLALHLGISRNPAKAVRALNAGRIARIDAARLDGRPFFCTAGVGLDADVAWDFARSPKRGLGTYISTAWGLWKHGDRAHRYRVTTDAGTWSGPAVIITVGNANQWGNEARIVPKASLRDGLLDVTVVEPFSTWEIPFLAAQLMTGKADASRRVRSFRSARVQISRDHPGPAHCDGDPRRFGAGDSSGGAGRGRPAVPAGEDLVAAVRVGRVPIGKQIAVTVHAMVVDFLFVRIRQGVPPARAGGIAHQRLIHLPVRGSLGLALAGDSFFLGDGQGRPPYFKIVVTHVLGNWLGRQR